MNIVYPIKDKEKIAQMKKLLSNNKRNLLLFNLGINSGLKSFEKNWQIYEWNLDIMNMIRLNLVKFEEKQNPV